MREKETENWYDFYYKSFESIGVENKKIKTKEELIKVMNSYKNEKFNSLENKELTKLQKKTIDEINNISIF
jgi:hypothetical protein